MEKGVRLTCCPAIGVVVACRGGNGRANDRAPCTHHLSVYHRLPHVQRTWATRLRLRRRMGHTWEAPALPGSRFYASQGDQAPCFFRMVSEAAPILCAALGT